jgi:hypothetical protein
VLLVLIIACWSVGTLVYARAATRAEEIACVSHSVRAVRVLAVWHAQRGVGLPQSQMQSRTWDDAAIQPTLLHRIEGSRPRETTPTGVSGSTPLAN